VGDESIGLCISTIDITDRKNALEKLEAANDDLLKKTKELAYSNTELEQFAYVASHDLQEPLRMVTSFLSQLEKKYGDILDEKGKKYIYFATDGAKRMRQLILDLLEFSRVGRTEDSLEDVDLNNLINEVLPLYRKNIEELNAKINVEQLPTLQVYKTPVRQIFQNLVGNSLKYHKDGIAPVITISSKETKKAFEFSVKDNGIGIDPEYFNQIFIIFKRLHNRDHYSGTGMGLAITKKIIENMGGRIWVDSREGEGAVFHFTIPKYPNR
jgi:light-regulated signal transduction histidine kinase (bacteriophytochrome)